MIKKAATLGNNMTLAFLSFYRITRIFTSFFFLKTGKMTKRQKGRLTPYRALLSLDAEHGPRTVNSWSAFLPAFLPARRA